jgi:hypothetical protein
VTSDAIKVFVSSTSEDLTDHRAVARNVILEMNWQPVMMEYMGASPKGTVTACQELVDTCDLLVLIVARRQGWVPSIEQGGNGEDSVTAFELAHAQSENLNVQVLAILADDDWPGKLWEEDQTARDWVKQFRDNLNLPAVFFSHEDDPKLPAFRILLKEQLVKYSEELLERKARKVDEGSSLAYFTEARDGMINSDNIPFIGPLIYGEGPLSPSALAHALAPELEQEDLVLATAAEHREQQTGSRDVFLKKLTEIINEQSAQAPSCRIHELITSMTKPWFVVYTGFDRKLEEQLDAAKLSYVVVAHIVRSYESEHDGKILVLRNDAPPDIRLADELELGDDVNVIYRPLGSPLLHEGLDEDLELDTVVITESDHLAFLGRNEHESTQTPTRFARKLDRLPLLFLGYPQDRWHFRLVMKVFQSVGGHYRHASTFAVRKPVSYIEDMAWTRLGTKLIPIELDEFVDHVIDSGAELIST